MTNKIKIAWVFLLFLGLSCKKTKLEGDLSVLVGEWEWVETRKSNENDCSVYTYQNPSTEGYTYSMKFLESGKLELYKNNQKIDSYRLVRYSYSELGADTKLITFKLNNRKKNLFGLRFKDRVSDTLTDISLFPLKPPKDLGCSGYFENVFVRK